jgi:hypothetical protein
MQEDPAHAALAYVTKADVHALADFRDQTVLAVKMKPGTKLSTGAAAFFVFKPPFHASQLIQTRRPARSA